MVAAASAAVVSRTAMKPVHKSSPVVTRPNNPPANLSRRPLTPSERDNAGFSRRPRTKEIASRYLSLNSSSASSTTCTSYSSNNATSASSPSFSSRRCTSPLPKHRPSTPSTFSQGLTSKRSQSVDRTRPSTPRLDPRGASAAEGSDAARALCTTTRSLSVSFQGESFFYQTSKAKAGATIPCRKATPDRRPNTPVRNSTTGIEDQFENPKVPDHHHRWPAARSRQSSLLTKSLDCSGGRNDLLSSVQLLRQSMLFEGGSGRASFDGAELSASSDTDSVSSGSNCGAPELNAHRHARVTSRVISVPARFWQETSNRLRRLPEPGTPVSSVGSRNSVKQKIANVKRSIGDKCLSLSVSSPLGGAVRPSSPSKLEGSPSRGIASPLRARSGSTMGSSLHVGLTANAPSIISFAAEVRRTKKGENRIEEAHMLRLLHNQHLQWRCVNARANAGLMNQRVAAERNLYNAWITISEQRDLVTIKKIKLHFLTLYLKLTTILKGQMVYLEETSLLIREHSSSLAGSIESLKASTLRIPVVSGARADLQKVKDAVGSAVDVMQAMGASMSLMLKVEGTKSLVSELAKTAAQEQALLDQSRNLLSTVAALHVKHCSLRGHLLQLRPRTRER